MTEIRWHGANWLLDTEAPDLHADTHISRRMQERVLSDPGDAGAWETLAHTYDEQAAEWRAWTSEQTGYDWPVRAGLRAAAPTDWVLELCCGTGEATGAIADVVSRVVATDLNHSMLADREDVPGVHWLAADVRSLPFRSGDVPLIVALNGVLFPAELKRVLRPGGQLLWCTAFGPGTPLYVEPQRIHEQLGPGWTLDRGNSGHGEWALFTAPG